jgi:hypothetical protein
MKTTTALELYYQMLKLYMTGAIQVRSGLQRAFSNRDWIRDATILRVSRIGRFSDRHLDQLAR